MRVVRTKSDIADAVSLGCERGRTFVVSSKDAKAFAEDMGQHGWAVVVIEEAPKALSWVVLAPRLPDREAAAATADVSVPATSPYRPEGISADEIQNEIRYENVDTGDQALDTSSGLAPGAGHPLHRPRAFGEGQPRFVRFMWDPWTGAMVLSGDEARDHSAMLANHRRKRKERGQETTPFDGWIRGYYVPDTGQVMLRPWDWPKEGKEHDPIAERVTGSIGERIKSKLLWLLSKELGVPFGKLRDKAEYYLRDSDLQEMFGKRRF
jgi:hypothetical protein